MIWCIESVDVPIDWDSFNSDIWGNINYWELVDSRLRSYKAQIDKETGLLEFESIEDYNWFILRWS